MDKDTDTDVLLALTASLLEDGHHCSQSVLFDALLKCDGDPAAAADLVRKRGAKRSRGRLDDWISSTSPTKAVRKSVEFKSSTSAGTSQRQTALIQPPTLTLSNPFQIAEQTPCTLHDSFLSPKLASALYYELVDKSVHWIPNKWWLFDKLVQSPHKTTFLVRNDPDSEIWKESAQLWLVFSRTRDSSLTF